jgi:beta-galactosidase
MLKKFQLTVAFLFIILNVFPGEIHLQQVASVDQVYMDKYESENLLPMNSLNMEFGYLLYQAEITTGSEIAQLELENVRDYAAVYLDGRLQGTLSDDSRKISLKAKEGTHQLQLYVENIGRITYGPEILDNSKGLFGRVTLNGEDILNWTIIPLNIKNYPLKELRFQKKDNVQLPGFYKGNFSIDALRNLYLDVSGWGMGEVWINNRYLGSFWEMEKQQSIQIRANDLVKGMNEIIVFELKNNRQQTMKLSENPVFK